MRFLLLVLLVACVGSNDSQPDANTTPVNPIGTWRVSFQDTSNTCNSMTSGTDTISVLQGTNGYNATDQTMGTPSGSVVCDTASCIADLQFVITTGTYRYNMTLYPDGRITGTGGYLDSSSCRIAFSITGARS